MKIFVAFTETDVELFNSIVTSDDIVVGYSDIYADNMYDVGTIKIRLDEHMEFIRELVKKVSLSSDIDLKGFANNFFECTIRPSLRYIEAIRNLLYKHDVESIVFSKKISNAKGMVNYYLGEHESQGRFYYNRRFALQQGILNFLGVSEVKVEFLSSMVSLQAFKNAYRDLGVFTLKAFKACVGAIKRVEPIIPDGYSGHILVVRSSTQLEFVRPLLEQCNVELTLYCGKVFSEENIFHKAIELTAALDNIQVVELDPSSLGEVIKHYSNAVLKILTLKNVFYLKGDVRICVKQAIREILIMATEVELYKAQLQRSIPSNDFGNSILFTCEQKSPHGYIDSCVAIEKGYICVQLMTCDQECNDLPYPVYGDCFFVDTLKRLDLFRLNWSTSTESIYYEGSIKLLGNQGKLKSHISKFKFCYFADISEIEHNLKTIKYLELESIENGGFKYCIKLHPRDDGNWIKKMNFSNGTVIRHGDVSSADLFLSFDIAISNPSAVVMDLLCRDRVFIYLNILKFYRNVENVYTDQYYKGIVNKWQDFSILLKDPSILNSEVKALKKRVFGDKALIPSIESLAMKCATNLVKVKNVRN